MQNDGRFGPLAPLLIGLSATLCAAAAVSLPPAAKTVDASEEYFGTKVADPYRWLEDAKSPDVRAYAEAQNARTRAFLDGPDRAALRSRLEELINYPRSTLPARYGTADRVRLLFDRNTGLENQDELFVRDGFDGPDRLLLNPNKLSADGTIALNGTHATLDGKLLAYGLSSGGSDQKDFHVRDMDSGTDLPDVLKWCRFSSVAWTRDDRGFFYNRFPTPGTVPASEETFHNKIYYHNLGSKQEDDPVVYERPDDREMEFGAMVTEDGRYLLIDAVHGTSPKNRLYYLASQHGSDLLTGPIVKLFDAEDAKYEPIENVESTLYVLTDKDAPRGRIVAVDLSKPDQKELKEIVPQGADTIDRAVVINNQLVLTVMHDAHQLLKVYELDGKFVRDIELPELGSVNGVSGFKHDPWMLYSFTSFTRPPTVYKYDFASNRSTVYSEPKPPFDPSAYETEQVFYSSKDGTRVPMFIVHKKGMKRDGTTPTILYGYGGFAISMMPRFSSSRIAWLERGGAWAVANIRGGAEYGEAWHQAAILEHRQKAYDDFIAAAQFLVDQHYTRTNRLAIEGGSNGGLLVAACMVQRPDLFGAVLCHVPVIDMLRYSRMGIGHFWVPEYGDARSSESIFKALYAYSPLHNVKEGQLYPPVLITTGDGDDRVVPAHPLKFCATLQAKADPRSLVFLRYETRAGHGGGKPISKVLDEAADGYAFLDKVFAR